MKYNKKSGLFVGSNVTYNEETGEAFSYAWWCFVKEIEGVRVFNKYNYSTTTCKHQHKVKTLLRNLEVPIQIEVIEPNGLQEITKLDDLLPDLQKRYDILINKSLRARQRKDKYLAEAEELQKYILLIKNRGETY